jgi:type VI secretion system protein ImpJ
MLQYAHGTMKLLSRVVWSEGMHLGPHHFQVQNRYFEDSIQFATSSLWFASYGLTGLEMDAEALQNGTVALLHARGVFRDGLAFNMPESDVLPSPRAVADLFPPTRDGVIVALGIPPRKLNGFNCALENGVEARYIAEARTLHDENTGSDERQIRLGRKNLRLIFDTEPAGDLLTLPLARVVRDGAGHFEYDPTFVPPVLRISASRRLMALVQRLIEILDEKSATISRGAGSGRAEFATREIANFWLLHAVNSALPMLRHQLVAKRGHPEELFVELSRLAGALCTFALDSHPRDLPLYDHENLSDGFEKLDRHIRAHLETIVPTNCVSIPLEPAGDYFYEGEITDARVFGRSRWVFAIHSEIGEADLMVRTPQLIKICTPPFVRELVKRALPGMGLTHLPVPPQAIATRPEVQYFGISRSGPCWDHMVKTRRVGVYAPGEFPNPELEILVVLES